MELTPWVDRYATCSYYLAGILHRLPIGAGLHNALLYSQPRNNDETKATTNKVLILATVFWPLLVVVPVAGLTAL